MTAVVVETTTDEGIRHEQSNNFEVKDGHLFVHRQGGGFSAVYAPGIWEAAVVERES